MIYFNLYFQEYIYIPIMEGNQSRGTRRKGPLGKSACWLSLQLCAAGFFIGSDPFP